MDILYQKIALALSKRKPLKNTIIIEGHNDFDSNGGALYDYLIKNGYNKKYKIIWLLKHEKPSGMKLPENVETYYLKKPSYKKDKALVTAKYIFTCNNAIGSFREDQVSMYMTHGAVALKIVIGLMDIPQNVTYVLAPSKFWEPIIDKVYNLSSNTKKVILGYPIHDTLYTQSNNELKKVTKKKYKKVILWMPTFRKGGGESRNDSSVDLPLGIPLFKDFSSLNEMNELLSKNNSLLIIKLHPMLDMSSVEYHDLSNIIFLDGETTRKIGIDNYRLMKDTDALISDYSSAAYDYLHLNKPIAFVLDDLKYYKIPIFEDYKSLIAGESIYTQDELINFVQEVIEGKDTTAQKRNQVFEKVFKYHDGNSCKRIVDFLKL